MDAPQVEAPDDDIQPLSARVMPGDDASINVS
jgi:hypothetical protein